MTAFDILNYMETALSENYSEYIINSSSGEDQDYSISDYLYLDVDDVWGSGYDYTIYGLYILTLMLYLTHNIAICTNFWWSPLDFTAFLRGQDFNENNEPNYGSITNQNPQYYYDSGGAETMRHIECFEMCSISNVSGFITRYLDPGLTYLNSLSSTDFESEDDYNAMLWLKYKLTSFKSILLQSVNQEDNSTIGNFTIGYNGYNNSTQTKLKLTFNHNNYTLMYNNSGEYNVEGVITNSSETIDNIESEIYNNSEYTFHVDLYGNGFFTPPSEE